MTVAVFPPAAPVARGGAAFPPGSSGGGGSPATVATTVAGLGAGTDGKLGMIRVGTWPDVEYVEVIYDATNSKWIGRSYPLVFQTDLAYMSGNATTYTYLSTDTTGSATASSIGVSVKPVRHATELFAAGLTLQSNMIAITKGASAPATLTTIARFFQHNDGDTVTFSTDGSTGVGETATIVSPNSASIVYKATGWGDVVQLGTSTTLATAQVTKANLWPRLYTKSSAANFGGVIDVDLQVRWVA